MASLVDFSECAFSELLHHFVFADFGATEESALYTGRGRGGGGRQGGVQAIVVEVEVEIEVAVLIVGVGSRDEL